MEGEQLGTPPVKGNNLELTHHIPQLMKVPFSLVFNSDFLRLHWHPIFTSVPGESLEANTPSMIPNFNLFVFTNFGRCNQPDI